MVREKFVAAGTDTSILLFKQTILFISTQENQMSLNAVVTETWIFTNDLMKGNEAVIKQKRHFMALRMSSLFPWHYLIIVHKGHCSRNQNKQRWQVSLNSSSCVVLLCSLMLLLPFCPCSCVFPLVFFSSSQRDSCKSWNSKLLSKYSNVGNHFKAAQNEALNPLCSLFF